MLDDTTVMLTRSQDGSDADHKRTQDWPDRTAQSIRGDERCEEKSCTRPDAGAPHLYWLDPAAPTCDDCARGGAQQASNNPARYQSTRADSVSHD